MNHAHYAKINDPVILAAALSFKLIKNHAFVNSNKCTALLAANLFLRLNRYKLQEEILKLGDNTAVKEAHNAVATGQLVEEELANIYRAQVKESSETQVAEAEDFLQRHGD